MNVADYRASRRRGVDLPSGLHIELRKPNPDRALRRWPLDAELTKRMMIQMVDLGIDPSTDPSSLGKQSGEMLERLLAMNVEQQQAVIRDYAAFAAVLVCDAAVEPRLVPYEHEANNAALWFDELDREDQLVLHDAVAELLGVTQADLVTLAPFRQSADAGQHGVTDESGVGD